MVLVRNHSSVDDGPVSGVRAVRFQMDQDVENKTIRREMKTLWFNLLRQTSNMAETVLTWMCVCVCVSALWPCCCSLMQLLKQTDEL